MDYLSVNFLIVKYAIAKKMFTIVGNWIKDTKDCSVLYFTTVCESMII